MINVKVQKKGSEMKQSSFGEILLYQCSDGTSALDVHLKDETVWLTLNQIAELFERDKSVISRHLHNVFKEGELNREAVVAKNATTASDGKTYQVEYFNFDAILSVGYRVNSRRGTQFRIWATTVLKDHLVRGYSLNQQRLAEKGVAELQQALALHTTTLTGHDLISDEGRAVLDIITRYAGTWQLLLQYDEDTLPLVQSQSKAEAVLEIEAVRRAIAILKRELAGRGEATALFGQERGHTLAGIIGAVQQSFGGEELYPSLELKAAHLLYFVIKDHPFSDGNKRIGSFLFLLFLAANNQEETGRFDNRALVALTLLTAASDAAQKDLMIRLIVNLLSITG